MNQIDESKTIYTDKGTPIHWLNKTYENFLDKSTLIYGSSGSGKTTIIEEILYFCKPYIPVFIVIAPRTSDKAYRKKLPARCIKEDLTKRTLELIWKRQFNLTQVYQIANDPINLESLFKKAPDRESTIMIQAIIHRANNKIDEINRNSALNYAQKKSQIISVEESRNKRIKKIYKESIMKYKTTLERQSLTDKEKITLYNIDINPRLMLIIDDCSEKFKGWMKMFKGKGDMNIFECIFYRGRHNFISILMSSHDDKIIDTEIRKNARVTIYCNSQSLVASINKPQSGFTPQEKKQAMEMAGKIFGNEDYGIKTHQKFCYIREDNYPFRYTIANLYPEFTLGSDSLHELIRKMPKNDDNIENNPFLKDIIDDRQEKKK